MAVRARPQAAPSREYLRLLDDLILRYYRRLLDPEDEQTKVGDFLKMIELRHNVTPQGADQGRFWKELEKIRQSALAAEKQSASARPSGAPPVRRKEK